MEIVLERQFELSKYGGISISESSTMAYLDFDLYYSLLVKKIKEEQEN